MKIAIWKYAVQVSDQFSIDMPKGSKILSVHTQHGIPHMWVMTWQRHNLPMTSVRFRVLGTGHEHDQEWVEGFRFVGTFIMRQDSLVFHLFVEEAH